MTAAVSGAAQDLQFCEGCERRFPGHRLCPVTYYCESCLRRVARQTARSLAVLESRS